MEKIKCADLFLVKSEDGKEFVGVDFDFTKEVTSRQGGVFVLDFLRQCMNSAGWTTRTIMEIKETPDAPTDGKGNSESDKVTEAD